MKHFSHIIILLSVFLVASCSNQEEKISRQTLMDISLEDRIDKFMDNRQKKCRKQYMANIEYEVDSLMFYLVQKMEGQSNQMPPRPNRPPRLVDSIKLIPR